jgi:hypothetical protein
MKVDVNFWNSRSNFDMKAKIKKGKDAISKN